ncbi:ATP-binding protein [Actinoplanes sp. NPDC049599]|uniref:ATP-binding protein n=1 Tax=Actinoplanes sp. NPDC049599 TaxID=3363903 RepID=UPI00378FEBBE
MTTEAVGAPGPVLLCLAGPFAIRDSGAAAALPVIGSRKARTLLKLLAVRRAGPVPMDRIVDVLWGDAPPRRAADNVATLVSRLRARFGAALVTGGRDGYRLGRAPAVVVDLDLAAADLTGAAARLAAGEPGLAAAVAARVLELLGTGEALPEDRDAEWARPARAEAAELLRRGRQLAAAAALATGDAETARDLAGAAIGADPYDEAAHRLLMEAEATLGRPARALAAYERLRVALAEEFGTDPAAETREVHLRILREEPATAARVPGPAVAAEAPLTGRAGETSRLAGAWREAAAGRPALVLISGEAGIGKTRLAGAVAELAGRTGGVVLSVRCYAAESSLFLQPFVDALGGHAARSPAALVRSLASPALAELVPQVGALVGDEPGPAVAPDLARGRAYAAVTAYLSGIAARQPVLLLLDDLHHAGLATVELLHYLARHARGRLLVLATVRAEEGAPVLHALAAVADRLDLGPLPADAVTSLAAGAGQAQLAPRILHRTGGHALFVVETLRALAAGDQGIPESLQAAVLARVARTGTAVEELLRAAAILDATMEPGLLADLLAVPPAEAVRRCEQALTARLLVVAGRAYEFANDLIREVLYTTTPAPARVAYHRRAGELLSDHPEQVAAHAHAAGDWDRAARAYLVAGEQAGGRFAAADAEALLTSALEAAERAQAPEVTGRAYQARGRVREALAAYPAALADFHAAVRTARQVGDRRLEMIGLRELGGDAPIALGQPIGQCVEHLRAGLAIAGSLGDRTMEADLLSRLAVVSGARLQLADALMYARRAVLTSRSGHDERALAVALDGLKTSWAYLGEIGRLVPVLDELEPLLHKQNDLWRLQWALFEGAFPAIAAGRWGDALDRIEAAREVNRRSGYGAYAGWFVGNLGWVHQLRGDHRRAIGYGRRAYALTSDTNHPWWRVAACAQLAGSLLAAGAGAEAVTLLEEGCERGGGEAYRLRCLGPLAAATGSRRLLAEADALVAGIQTPPGCAWLFGADAYLAVGRGWLRHGEPARARTVIAPVLAAANRVPWRPVQVPALVLDAAAAEAAGAESAPQRATAERLAREFGLTHLVT